MKKSWDQLCPFLKKSRPTRDVWFFKKCTNCAAKITDEKELNLWYKPWFSTPMKADDWFINISYLDYYRIHSLKYPRSTTLSRRCIIRVCDKDSIPLSKEIMTIIIIIIIFSIERIHLTRILGFQFGFFSSFEYPDETNGHKVGPWANFNYVTQKKFQRINTNTGLKSFIKSRYWVVQK